MRRAKDPKVRGVAGKHSPDLLHGTLWLARHRGGVHTLQHVPRTRIELLEQVAEAIGIYSNWSYTGMGFSPNAHRRKM